MNKQGKVNACVVVVLCRGSTQNRGKTRQGTTGQIMIHRNISIVFGGNPHKYIRLQVYIDTEHTRVSSTKVFIFCLKMLTGYDSNPSPCHNENLLALFSVPVLGLRVSLVVMFAMLYQQDFHSVFAVAFIPAFLCKINCGAIVTVSVTPGEERRVEQGGKPAGHLREG